MTIRMETPHHWHLMPANPVWGETEDIPFRCPDTVASLPLTGRPARCCGGYVGRRYATRAEAEAARPS